MKKFNAKTIVKHLKTVIIIFLGISVCGFSSNQSELENQLEESQQLLVNSQEETNTLKTELKSQTKKLADLEDKEKSHQDELDKQKEETKLVQEELKTKETELKDLKSKYEKLEKEHQELRTKHTELDQSFQNYKNQNDPYIELGKQAQQASSSVNNQQYGFAQSQAPVTTSVYYQNCSAARAAGAAPVRAGDPGYGRHLDRDGDGIGCE